MFRWLTHAWRTLTRGADLDRELRDELDSYVGLAADEDVSRGAPPDDARRRALARMGGLPQVEEHVRAGRRGAWLAQAFQDARYAVRALARTPAFAASVVLTLGIAIGATATVFTAVRAVVLAPLPYPDADALVELTNQGYIGEYLQYRERSRVMDVALYAPASPLTLTGHGDPMRLERVNASVELFDLLGVRPAIGREWTPADTVPGADPVVTISDRLWRERLGADPQAAGSTLVLDGVARRVAGVMPAGFAFPHAEIDLWVPATIDPADRITTWSTGGAIVGRLRAGETLEAARAEIRALAPAFASLFPWRMPEGYGEDASAVGLKERLVGETDVMFLAAMAAVAVVFVIACLNVGVLLVGRSMARRAEMATRAALGASRGRLARQALVECGVLAALGGAAALALATFSLAALVRSLPAEVPRLHEIAPDAWLGATVGALAGLAGLLIAVVPTWRAARPAQAPVPGQRHAGQDRGARVATQALVAVEVALAVTLVFGAGLLVRSLDRLLDVDPGFRPDHVLSATITPPSATYPDDGARRAFYADALSRVAAMPGIEAAAVTDRLPFASPPWGSVFAIDGRPDPATVSGDWPWADYRSTVSPSFFATLGLDVVRGRGFSDADGAGAERVAVVSRALARAYWPGDDAVGQRIRFPGMPAGEWIRIVGVVADAKWERLNEEPRTALYEPLAQAAADGMSLIVRTAERRDDVPAGVMAAVRSIDDDTPVDRVAWLSELVGRSARTSQFLAVLFAGFAGVGLLLGGLGIFGVTSEAVARRAHEIAVRLAIGAEPGAIVRLVVRQSLMLAAVGLLAGVAAALAAARYLSSLLFGVAPGDPATLAAVVATLALVVAASCYAPARRAARIRPVEALKS